MALSIPVLAAVTVTNSNVQTPWGKDNRKINFTHVHNLLQVTRHCHEGRTDEAHGPKERQDDQQDLNIKCLINHEINH